MLRSACAVLLPLACLADPDAVSFGGLIQRKWKMLVCVVLGSMTCERESVGSSGSGGAAGGRLAAATTAAQNNTREVPTWPAPRPATGP